METVFDPLRRKEVALTPEEQVRQWFISLLAEQMEVPLPMMMSEVPFRLGEKKLRADIVVWARDLSPMMIVECKRPSVALTQEVLDQILRYNRVLDVPFIVATNGQNTYICKRTAEGPQWLPSPPTYAQMLEYYEQYHHGRVSGA
ncbi:MAG: type I restriction enzyme HsdR N-terminal domain-containing protein [Bacteroidales bacterium]|nr:type I restriction enzyme HsdR N-terminal domain-containing protein [Bacteroidales bacterium]